MGKWLNMGIWEVRSPTRFVKLKPCCNHPKVVENQGDIWLQIFQDFDISLMRQQLMCSSWTCFKILLLWCSLWTHRNTPQKLSNVILVNEAFEALGDEKSPTRNGSIPEEPALGWRTCSCVRDGIWWKWHTCFPCPKPIVTVQKKNTEHNGIVFYNIWVVYVDVEPSPQRWSMNSSQQHKRCYHLRPWSCCAWSVRRQTCLDLIHPLGPRPITHDGSMVLLYMVTWIPSIYPKC